jgi:hypothetical protein
VRQFIDGGLRTTRATLEDDLAAIEESFGTLSDDVYEPVARVGGERELHLDRMWSR